MIRAAFIAAALLAVAVHCAPAPMPQSEPAPETAPLPDCGKGRFRQMDGGCGAEMPPMPQMAPMMGGYPMNPMMSNYGMWPGQGSYMGVGYMPQPHGPMPFGMGPQAHHFGMPQNFMMPPPQNFMMPPQNFMMPPQNFGMMPMDGDDDMSQNHQAFGQMPPNFIYDMSHYYPKNENVEQTPPQVPTTEAPKVVATEIPVAPKLPPPPPPPQRPYYPKDPKPVKDPKPDRPKLVKDPPHHMAGQQPFQFGNNYPNLQSLLQIMNPPQQPQRPKKPMKPHKKPKPAPEEEYASHNELPPFKFITDFSEEDALAYENQSKSPKQSVQQPPAVLQPSQAMGCPATDDRYRPVLFKHENCRKFYKCTNGQAVAQECPPHLMYSEAANRCVLMRGGEC